MDIPDRKQIGFSIYSETDSAAYVYNAQAGDNSRGFSTIDLEPANAAVAATPTNGLRHVDLRF